MTGGGQSSFRNHRMKINRKMYEGVLENISQGVRFITLTGQTFFWNKGAQEITGFAHDEMVGALCEALHIVREENESDACADLCPLKNIEAAQDTPDIKVYLRHRDGHLIPVMMRFMPLYDDKGGTVGIAEMFHDLTWKEDAASQLDTLAGISLVDPLTEVGNRKYADKTLNAKGEEFRRYSTRYGLAMVDVDDMGRINETHGNEVGDRMMKVISRSLGGTLRPFDTICRWESDEFIIVAANIRNDQNMMNLANRIRLLVEQSSLTLNDGQKIRATVSVGAVICRPDEAEQDAVQRAQGLLVQSKSLGKNIVTMARDFIGSK